MKNKNKENPDARKDDIQDLSEDNLEQVSGGGLFSGLFGNTKGTGKNDKLKGSIFNDTINAGAGNDFVDGGWGNDTIDGGSGNDVLLGGWGNDTIDGGTGNDTIDGGSGNDTIDGGSGNDSIKGGDGNDTIDGGSGNDTIDGGSGNDTIEGGSGNDRIDGGSGNDNIDGGSGNDRIDGGDGKDRIDGGSGNDNIDGGGGNDRIDGGDGNDTIDGGDGNDTIDGGDGNDTIDGGLGRDVIDGGAGNDTIDGGAGDDIITGGEGNDYLQGGAGNDFFNYSFGHDSDVIDGGSGKDTLKLDNISSPDDWTVTIDGVESTLADLMNDSGDIRFTDASGVITCPDGSTIEFLHLERIHVDQVEQVPYEPLPLQVKVPEVEGRVAVVVSGLPPGVALQGQASPPVLGEDGTFFQVVDADSLEAGDIGLVFGNGFMGEINLTVSTFTGDPSNPTLAESSEYTYDIEPRPESVMFAQAGSFGTEVSPSGELVQSDIPVDIIVNPLLADSVGISLSGIPDGVFLTNSAGEVFTAVNGSLELSPSDLTGLRIDSSSLSGDFELNVSVHGEFEGDDIRVSNNIHIEQSDVETSPNGDTVIRLEGNRADFNVERVGNAFVVTNIHDPSDVTRVSMVDVDHLRFNDAFVSSDDFTQSVDISGLMTQLEGIDATPESLLIVVNGLPSGAIVDGAVDLGNGTFGIQMSAVANAELNLDFPGLSAEARAEISISACVMTEAQQEFLGGMGRVYGLATAQATAEAGAGAEFYIGPDGFRAELSAYLSASAVATAGGSVSLDGVGTLSAEVGVEGHVEAEATLGMEVSATGMSIQAYVGAEAGASASGSVEFEADFIPSTGAGAEGTVGVRAYANAGGQGEAHWGDGEYGVEGEGGAEAGVMAEAEGTISGSIGGIGGSVTGGVGVGLAVGISGGGHAGYDDGVIHFGLSGDVALLIGVEFDFDIEIDLNAVAETAELIAEGVVTAVEAIQDGLVTAAEAIEEGFIVLSDAIEDGLIAAADAIEEGLIDAGQAIEAGYIRARDAVAQGLMTAADAIEDGYMQVRDALKAGFMDAGEAIEDGFITVRDAITGRFIDAADAIEEGFIDAEEAVRNGFITATRAISEGVMEVHDAIRDGLITATDAVASGFLTATNAINEGLMTAASAVSHGFMTATYAINNGFMTARNALEHGFISVRSAIEDFGEDARDLAAAGWEAAEDFFEDVGSAIVDFFSGW